jgi:uncharacterized membrane protein YebE (DUF533 family)
MLNTAKQRVFIALFLMGALFFGPMAAEARDTKGADRLIKGAVIGAAVGAGTQVVRGRREGKELLKGAAVGATAGAAVGAYSDYRQEKKERERAERRADYRDYRRYDRSSRPAYRWQDDQAYRQGGRRGGHRHNGRCNH